MALALVVAACGTADGEGEAEQAGVPAEDDGSTGGETAADEATPQPDGLPPAEPFFWEPDGNPDAPSLISLDEIIPGGPPPDGIPPIDQPQYTSIAEADEWLEDQEPVLVLEIDGTARAYPIQILTFHEIVNDVLAGQPVLVTYCPLCNSGLAFDPTIRGETLDFGTSGRLFQSNLIMYDRQTQSLWSQFTGQAVTGPLIEEELERLPLGLVAWQDFIAAHPDGDVLSRDTGHSRDYGTNPYVGYDSSADPFLFSGPTDDTLPQMARVVATGGAEDPTAVPLDALRSELAINTDIAGQPVVAWWTPGTSSALDSRAIAEGTDVGATGVFVRVVDGRTLTFEPGDDQDFTDVETGSTWNVLGQATSGSLAGSQLTRLPSDDTFWFVQFAFRPETRLVTR